jgi:hypothetical protein
MNNNPITYADPDGDIAWFVPIIIGAAIGGTTGGIVAHNNGQSWWKGAIVGAFAGAAVGAAIAPAIGATGITTSAGVISQSWGITTTAINSANINMGISLLQGNGNLDNLYKSALVGAASGAFSATGGFGMVGQMDKTNLFRKLAYQAIGTSGRSIGNNWASGKPLFSKVSVGVGPVNLTFGKGQKLLQWQNNIGNIATNAIGLTNLAFGGNVKFDLKNLTPVYTGGFLENYGGAWGAHVIKGPERTVNSVYDHEMTHVWQSRALGDMYLAHYAGQGLLSSIISGSFINPSSNYFELMADILGGLH